jgi:hypothetical protein
MAKKIDAKTLNALAGIAAALSHVDGITDEGEVAAFVVAAEEMGASEADATDAINAHLEALDGGTKPEDLLAACCRSVGKGHRRLAMQLATQVLLADGELTKSELHRLVATRMLLDASEELLLSLLANEAQSNPEFELAADVSEL